MTTNTAMPEPQSQTAVSTYQKLRGHLAVLKLDAAAEALPSVLQTAGDEEWSMTKMLEHLLAIEVSSCGSSPDRPCWSSMNSGTYHYPPKPPQHCFRLWHNDI